ncbi:hypothetical protein [Granulicatella adiacens]
MEKYYLSMKRVKNHDFIHYKSKNDYDYVDGFYIFDSYEKLYNAIATRCFKNDYYYGDEDAYIEDVVMERVSKEEIQKHEKDNDLYEWLSEQLTEEDYKEICENTEIPFIAFDIEKTISHFEDETKQLLNEYDTIDQRRIILNFFDYPWNEIEYAVQTWFEGDRDEFPSIGNIDIFKY